MTKKTGNLLIVVEALASLIFAFGIGLTPAHSAGNPFAINMPDPDLPPTLHRMPEAGIQWVRLNAYWRDMDMVLDQTVENRSVLGTWGEWEEWEVFVGEATVNAGCVSLYLEDDGLGTAVWSGARLESAFFVGLIFHDGFESGDLNAWSIFESE